MTILSKPAENPELEAAIAHVLNQVKETRAKIEEDQDEIDRSRERTARIWADIQTARAKTTALREEMQTLLDTLLPVPYLSKP
jgi:peptidoglycan hydrolase CwlO-like protein